MAGPTAGMNGFVVTPSVFAPFGHGRVILRWYVKIIVDSWKNPVDLVPLLTLFPHFPKYVSGYAPISHNTINVQRSTPNPHCRRGQWGGKICYSSRAFAGRGGDQ